MESGSKGKIDSTKSGSRLSLAEISRFATIASFDLVPEALQLAVTMAAPFTTACMFLWPCRRKQILITADERLANALAARLPVKWLGAL